MDEQRKGLFLRDQEIEELCTAGKDGFMFITDMGEAVAVDWTADGVLVVDRYAVWEHKAKRAGRAEVVEIGPDLVALQRKYKVSNQLVFRLGKDRKRAREARNGRARGSH